MRKKMRNWQLNFCYRCPRSLEFTYFCCTGCVFMHTRTCVCTCVQSTSEQVFQKQIISKILSSVCGASSWQTEHSHVASAFSETLWVYSFPSSCPLSTLIHYLNYIHSFLTSIIILCLRICFLLPPFLLKNIYSWQCLVS